MSGAASQELAPRRRRRLALHDSIANLRLTGRLSKKQRFPAVTPIMTTRVDMTTWGCHAVAVNEPKHPSSQAEIFARIKETRARAIEHTAAARRLGAERRELMQGLIREGVSQSEIARELGVSRQAIQKMLAC
jgi:DNA-directed RNA polymerase specialized sigma24 family protein